MGIGTTFLFLLMGSIMTATGLVFFISALIQSMRYMLEG